MEEKEDKILSSDTRKEILINLRQRNKTLSELSREIGVSKPALLKHLFLLSSMEAVKRIKNGNRFIYYKITEKGKRMTDLIVSLLAAFSGSALIQRFLFIPQKEVETASKEVPSEGLPRVPVPEEAPKIADISTPTPLPSPTSSPEFGVKYIPTLKIEAIAGFILIFLCVFIVLKLFRRKKQS